MPVSHSLLRSVLAGPILRRRRARRGDVLLHRSIFGGSTAQCDSSLIVRVPFTCVAVGGLWPRALHHALACRLPYRIAHSATPGCLPLVMRSFIHVAPDVHTPMLPTDSSALVDTRRRRADRLLTLSLLVVALRDVPPGLVPALDTALTGLERLQVRELLHALAGRRGLGELHTAIRSLRRALAEPGTDRRLVLHAARLQWDALGEPPF